MDIDELPEGMAQKLNDRRYREELATHLSLGWEVVSEGPSGAQLKKPKTMRTLDKIALVAGFILLIAYGLGLILIIAALLDYAFFTKEETKFLGR